MIPPCENCVCFAICRLKYPGRLFDECELVNTYVPNWSTKQRSDLDRLYVLEDILKPTRWYTRPKDGKGEPVIYSLSHITDPPQEIVIMKMIQ